MDKNKSHQLRIVKMLIDRRYFYILGYLISFICILINIALKAKIRPDEIIIIPFSLSFSFGFLLYIIIKEPKRLRKEGRSLILSKDGLINFSLTFGSLVVLGLVCKLLGF